MDVQKSSENQHQTHGRTNCVLETKTSDIEANSAGYGHHLTLDKHPDADPEGARARLSGISDPDDVFIVDVDLKSTAYNSMLRQRSLSKDESIHQQQTRENMVEQHPEDNHKPSGSQSASQTLCKNGDSRRVETTVARGADCRVNATPSGVDRKVYKPHVAGGLTRSRSQMERIRDLRIPKDSSFRQLARQLSGRAKYDVTDEPDSGDSGRRPKTFFDLALVTMCCCVSPLGIVAIVMSVLSDANYKAGHQRKSLTYSRLALAFSVVGIISSITIGITLLLLYRYPWDQVTHP